MTSASGGASRRGPPSPRGRMLAGVPGGGLIGITRRPDRYQAEERAARLDATISRNS